MTPTTELPWPFPDPKPDERFDRKTQRVVRDEAIQRVDRCADSALKLAAWEAILEAARSKESLTTDDVVREIDSSMCNGQEMRMLGPMMLRAAREKFIEKTSNRVESSMVSNHGREKTVWRSLIFKP